jgi:mRNA interferase MazF
MNHNIDSVIITPLTSTSKNYPFRVKIKFEGKTGWIVLDQIRDIDKFRLVKRAGILESKDVLCVKTIVRKNYHAT